jgi:hypothetical protein
MHIDDEMIIHQFMEEEADTDEEKNMSILKALVQLQEKEDTAPIPEGSSAGQIKIKALTETGGEFHMLYNDYFSDDSTYNEKDFRHRYRMNWELFKKIVHVVRAYDDYFCVEDRLHRYGWFIVI